MLYQLLPSTGIIIVVRWELLLSHITKYSDSSQQQQMLINNQMIIQNIMARKRRLKKPPTIKPLNELIGTSSE